MVAGSIVASLMMVRAAGCSARRPRNVLQFRMTARHHARRHGAGLMTCCVQVCCACGLRPSRGRGASMMEAPTADGDIMAAGDKKHVIRCGISQRPTRSGSIDTTPVRVGDSWLFGELPRVTSWCMPGALRTASVRVKRSLVLLNHCVAGRIARPVALVNQSVESRSIMSMLNAILAPVTAPDPVAGRMLPAASLPLRLKAGG